jgi:hypothetical protein
MRRNARVMSPLPRPGGGLMQNSRAPADCSRSATSAVWAACACTCRPPSMVGDARVRSLSASLPESQAPTRAAVVGRTDRRGKDSWTHREGENVCRPALGEATLERRTACHACSLGGRNAAQGRGGGRPKGTC